MNLKHLTDSTILKDIKALVQKEREYTTQILHHIREIDMRKLYSDLKYSSLFDYCVKELGYTDASAQRRIVAARLLKELPVIEKKIEQGNLTLSNIAKAAQFFKENEIQTEKEKNEILAQLENTSARECEKKLESLKTNQEITKTVRLSLKEETVIKLDQLRSLKGIYSSYDEIICELVEKANSRILKDKFKQNSGVNLTPTSEVKRVISAYVKRHVYLRDKKCTQCGTSHNLQFDHRIPFALGGTSSKENIRLLCFNCNQRARIKAKL